MEFRRSLGVIESPELLESSGMGSSLALSCNIRSFVIELDYGYPKKRKDGMPKKHGPKKKREKRG